jgi:hypothetical protein
MLAIKLTLDFGSALSPINLKNESYLMNYLCNVKYEASMAYNNLHKEEN